MDIMFYIINYKPLTLTDCSDNIGYNIEKLHIALVEEHYLLVNCRI